jgi:hypothetical protein
MWVSFIYILHLLLHLANICHVCLYLIILRQLMIGGMVMLFCCICSGDGTTMFKLVGDITSKWSTFNLVWIFCTSSPMKLEIFTSFLKDKLHVKNYKQIDRALVLKNCIFLYNCNSTMFTISINPCLLLL